MDGSDTEKVSAYLRAHLEPSKEMPVNTLLRNPDSRFQSALLSEGQIKTPFFGFEGRFTPLDAEPLINNIVHKQRQELIEAGKTHPLGQGKADGTDLALRMRLLENDDPVQKIDSLYIEGSIGQLALREIVPSEYPILWVPGEDVSRSAFNSELGLLIISGDISSPEGLFVALHESGHAIDIKQNAQLGNEMNSIQTNMMAPKEEELAGLDSGLVRDLLSKFGTVSEHNVQTFLKNERNAWAYAMRMMLKITDNKELLQAFKTYIHEQPMRMNSDILRDRGFIH